MILKRKITLVIYDPAGAEKGRIVKYNNDTQEGAIDIMRQFFTGVAYASAWWFGLITAVIGLQPDFTSTAIDMVQSPVAPNPPATNNWAEDTSARQSVDFSAAAFDDGFGNANKLSVNTMLFVAGSNISGSFLINAAGSGSTVGVLSGAMGWQGSGGIPVLGDTISATIEIQIGPA